MRSAIIYCIILLFAFTSACRNSTTAENAGNVYSELGKVDFLIGEWHNTTPEGIFTEVWEKQNDSVYAGRSYFITGNDTSFSETIRLEQRGAELYYIPLVSDQNSGQPVEFKLIASSPTQVVFENPHHDFPSRITYTLKTKDSLLAQISGTLYGKENSRLFPLKRPKL